MRIGRHALGRRLGRLHVDAAGHDQLVQPLELPAVLDQVGGEPVEQLRVRRPLALGAEIVGRGDNAPAEMVLPEAVDDDPGREMPAAELSGR